MVTIKKSVSKKSNTKKTSTKKSVAKKAVAPLSDKQFYGKLRHLGPGKSVSHAKFGTVKCTAAGKTTKNGKRAFSISKSTVAKNRGGYTFGEVCKAFGLSK